MSIAIMGRMSTCGCNKVRWWVKVELRWGWGLGDIVVAMGGVRLDKRTDILISWLLADGCILVFSESRTWIVEQ